jgi:hypothetical protein
MLYLEQVVCRRSLLGIDL